MHRQNFAACRAPGSSSNNRGAAAPLRGFHPAELRSITAAALALMKWKSWQELLSSGRRRDVTFCWGRQSSKRDRRLSSDRSRSRCCSWFRSRCPRFSKEKKKKNSCPSSESPQWFLHMIWFSLRKYSPWIDHEHVCPLGLNSWFQNWHLFSSMFRWFFACLCLNSNSWSGLKLRVTLCPTIQSAAQLNVHAEEITTFDGFEHC